MFLNNKARNKKCSENTQKITIAINELWTPISTIPIMPYYSFQSSTHNRTYHILYSIYFTPHKLSHIISYSLLYLCALHKLWYYCTNIRDTTRYVHDQKLFLNNLESQQVKNKVEKYNKISQKKLLDYFFQLLSGKWSWWRETRWWYDPCVFYNQQEMIKNISTEIHIKLLVLEEKNPHHLDHYYYNYYHAIIRLVICSFHLNCSIFSLVYFFLE